MNSFRCIVVGTSAGGLAALTEILSPLPKNFPVPILVVQHLSPVDTESYFVTYLNESCKLKVIEATDNEIIEKGIVYIAPANYHLLIEENGVLSLSVDRKVNFSRPSIDVLFESAADVYKSRLIGIILTGANSDGARGIKYIKELGGLTIVQDPVTAETDTMPKAAIKNSPIDYILPLDQIVSLLVKICFLK